MLKILKITAIVALTGIITANIWANGAKDTKETKEEAPVVEETETKNFRIGISKIVTHPALDALEKGIMEVVVEEYPDTVFDNQNANGDPATASTIAQKFKTDKVDIAVGIATPTAVALANAIDNIPVIFAAVTDPVDAGLVPSLQQSAGNITGTSDMTPVRDQIELLAGLIDLKTLGHVYSSGEANAVRLAEIAKQACEAMGIEFVSTTITSSAEVKQAAQSIAGRVDAIYVSTDNTVVSALPALTDAAAKSGIPVISADPSSAEETGVLIAWGFDYYKMGLATGRLIVEVMQGSDPASFPTRFMTSVDDVALFINLKIADDLGISIPASLTAKAATVVQ